MNGEFQSMWKEADVTNFKVLLQQTSGCTQEHQKMVSQSVDLWVENQNQDLPNVKQEF
jgi:hypothetical protein